MRSSSGRCPFAGATVVTVTPERKPVPAADPAVELVRETLAATGGTVRSEGRGRGGAEPPSRAASRRRAEMVRRVERVREQQRAMKERGPSLGD